mgnify:CR=1 FL=1
MSKIKTKITIHNKEINSTFETTAIVTDNKIKYYENENTLVIFDYNKNHLVRKNNELEMEYLFDENQETLGKIKIIELEKKLEIIIKTNKIRRNSWNIRVEFQIENNPFIYEIEEIK